MDELTTIETTAQYVAGFGESRIGGRSENQDSWSFSDTPFGFLLVVCDGMGGGPGGKTASTIATDEIIKGVKEGNKEEALPNILIKAVRSANLAIIHKGEEAMELKGMGSTCTVLLINEQSAITAHVGDSRIYQFRKQDKIFRTFDHSMVFDLVKKKVITEEQARLSAQSNIITRALGIKPDLEVEIHELPYESGDRFMLCTDGIHGAISEKDLIKLATDRKKKLDQCIEDLSMQIDNIGITTGGGHDNLTVAMIEVNSNSILKEKMSKRIKNILWAVGLICVISITLNIWQTLSHKVASNNEKEVTECVKEYILEGEEDGIKDRASSLVQTIDSTLQNKNYIINYTIEEKIKGE